MINTNTGYATIITCLLLPLVFLCLGLLTFSVLKTRHQQEIKSICLDQYHDYFTEVKSRINLIETLNPLALALIHTQQMLLPMIWIPPVLKAYMKIQNIRKRLDKMQSSLINTYNTLTNLAGYKVAANIQRKLQTENGKIKNILTHKTSTNFRFSRKLQIVKRFQTLFPPYDPTVNIAEKQAYTFFFKNQIQLKSWIGFFKIEKLNESYSCSATLKLNPGGNLLIDYII